MSGTTRATRHSTKRQPGGTTKSSTCFWTRARTVPSRPGTGRRRSTAPRRGGKTKLSNRCWTRALRYDTTVMMRSHSRMLSLPHTHSHSLSHTHPHALSRALAGACHHQVRRHATALGVVGWERCRRADAARQGHGCRRRQGQAQGHAAALRRCGWQRHSHPSAAEPWCRRSSHNQEG